MHDEGDEAGGGSRERQATMTIPKAIGARPKRISPSRSSSTGTELPASDAAEPRCYFFFVTVTVTALLVVVAPALSVARAVIV